MSTKYKVCQSCGMPLKLDGSFNGTEANGTISKKYCGFCYQNGKFVHTEISVSDMKDIVNNNENYPKVFKWYYTSKITKLERWGKTKEKDIIWMN